MTKNKKASTTKTKTSKNMKVASRSWLRYLLITSAKLAFAVFCLLAIFTIYLDAKVKRTFEGQRWQVPIQVYGQIPFYRVGEHINVDSLSQSLTFKGYQKVTFIEKPGQFSLSHNRIDIYRRDFEFAEKNDHSVNYAVKIVIEFTEQKISKILKDELSVFQVKLEPALLSRMVQDNKEDRVLLGLEKVPEQFVDTLLLVEDRDFYHHKGVSPVGILRALFNNLKAGRTVQGGSTLTQQLVKNMFLTNKRTLSRKVQEAIMALILEVRYSKDQLLEAYMNEVYLGQHFDNGIYGFGLASKFYFNRDIKELTNAQMALLVALVKGPSYYDPWRHPQRTIERRDLILRLMLEHNFISKAGYEQAVEDGLSIRKTRRFVNKYFPSYLQLVKAELQKHLTKKELSSGIRVFTGFSHQIQQNLEQAVSKQLPLLEKKSNSAKNLQVAMLITDVESGEIRALVGDKQKGYAGFNRALYAKRSIGSLMKPAIYLAALERYESFNFATIIDDKAVTIKNTSGDKWQPKNYDGKYRGQVPLIDGLVNSLNIPSVNLGMALGLENVVKSIHLLGYEKEINPRPSMLLGSLNMSPLEINQTYLTLAKHGEYQKNHSIIKVVNTAGEVLWQFNPATEQRLSKNGAYLIDYALKQVAISGTAKSLSWRLKKEGVAGKTGTSNDLRDSWFVGYDSKHLVTTWLGHDDNTPTGLTGSSGALVLFSDFMKRNGVVHKPYIKPAGVEKVLFEKATGNAVTEKCKNTVRYPAISAGITPSDKCLESKSVIGSWFDKVFGG
ncbi:MAG: penicillin-binding protein 1B [Colwellia sp.]